MSIIVGDKEFVKLAKSVERQREMLKKIAEIALAAEAKSANENVKLGSKYLDNSKALCEIRNICGPDLVEKASKFGLLANGVQMVRYAGGPTVTLIGKRDRGPCERHEGRTGKVIYKVTVSRETHSAEVSADGAALCTVFVKSSSRLEHYGLALLNSWLKFNARRNRHEKDRINRRKAEEVAK